MKPSPLSLLGIALALALLSTQVGAQRRRASPVVQLPDGGCTCTAEGADCFFGEAGGCSVTCPENNCVCKGAYCTFGFPHASKCYCR